MKWGLIVAAFILAGLTTGCGGSSGHTTRGAKPTPHTIAGGISTRGISIQLNHPGSEVGGPCGVPGAHGDVKEGANVQVTDEKGVIIGSTQLEAGVFTDIEPPDGINASPYGTCRFPFTVTVPDAKFYSVKVSAEEPVTYPRDKIASANWSVELTVS